MNKANPDWRGHLRRTGDSRGLAGFGVCLERSHQMLVAVLGVLKAGAAYLPLDPSHPTTHLELVLSDSQTVLLLTQENIASRLHTSARVVCVDSEQKLWARESGTDLETSGTSDSLAYVIYTSGSTGRPKGVAIEHGALSNLLRSMEREPGLTASDTLNLGHLRSPSILQAPSRYTFLPLMVGARLVIATRDSGQCDGHRLLNLIEEFPRSIS